MACLEQENQWMARLSDVLPSWQDSWRTGYDNALVRLWFLASQNCGWSVWTNRLSRFQRPNQWCQQLVHSSLRSNKIPVWNIGWQDIGQNYVLMLYFICTVFCTVGFGEFRFEFFAFLMVWHSESNLCNEQATFLPAITQSVWVLLTCLLDEGYFLHVVSRCFVFFWCLLLLSFLELSLVSCKTSFIL